MLVEAYDGSNGVARYDPTWEAYQAELALEEIIYGRPLSESDYQLSVILGTRTIGQFSLSYQRRFIGLVPHNAASVGEVPLPLCNWTKSALQMERIERLFALCQSLDATPSTTGAAVVAVALGDLFKRNSEVSWVM